MGFRCSGRGIPWKTALPSSTSTMRKSSVLAMATSADAPQHGLHCCRPLRWAVSRVATPGPGPASNAARSSRLYAGQCQGGYIGSLGVRIVRWARTPWIAYAIIADTINPCKPTHPPRPPCCRRLHQLGAAPADAPHSHPLRRRNGEVRDEKRRTRCCRMCSSWGRFRQVTSPPEMKIGCLHAHAQPAPAGRSRFG